MARRLIDLTGLIYNGMWSYDWTLPFPVPIAHLQPVSSREENGEEFWHLDLTSHTGTYLETAALSNEGRQTIDQLSLDQLFRPAKVLRLPDKGPRSLIYAEDLEKHAPKIDPGDALLIDTGWGPNWSSERYIPDTPCYHRSCFEWLRQQPMSIWAVDTPIAQAEYIPGREKDVDYGPGEGEIILPLFTENDILLLAPVVNLDTIQNLSGQLIALPVKAQGASAAPCRAIYIEES